MAWQTLKKTFANNQVIKKPTKRKSYKLQKQSGKHSKCKLIKNVNNEKENWKVNAKPNCLYEIDPESDTEVENVLANICTNTDFDICGSNEVQPENGIPIKEFRNRDCNKRSNYWLEPIFIDNYHSSNKSLQELKIIEQNNSPTGKKHNLTDFIKMETCKSFPAFRFFSKNFPYKNMSTKNNNSNYPKNEVILNNSEKNLQNVFGNIIKESIGNYTMDWKRRKDKKITVCTQQSELFPKNEIKYLGNVIESSTCHYSNILSQTSVENEELNGEKELELLIRDIQSYVGNEVSRKSIKPKNGGYVDKFRSALRSDRSNYYFWRNEYENSRIEGGSFGKIVEIKQVFQQTLLKIALQNETISILVDLQSKIYKGQNFSVGTKVICDIDSTPLCYANGKIYIAMNKIIKI